jgi:hypothetical protein
MNNQDMYAKLDWRINVHEYYSAMKGKRWRLSWDDDFIEDFDHKPNMAECMRALIKWWEN